MITMQNTGLIAGRFPKAVMSLVVTCLVAALLFFVPSDAFAASKGVDPVLQVINKARAQGQISSFEAAELRSDWARSNRALRQVRNASRRYVIERARREAVQLALSGSLTPERLKPVMLSVRASTWVMLYGAFPRHEQIVKIPNEIVVFKYYSGAAVQYQPFETLKVGMRYLNQSTPDLDGAKMVADRMLELGVRRGSSLVWEYYFPYGGSRKIIWTSAISQALATELMYRVGQAMMLGEEAVYFDSAEQISRSFLRNPSVGGVGTAEDDGRFYLMYSHYPRQRILNGHLQVLINVNRYAMATGSPVAHRVVELGIPVALRLLPQFDTGAWSNYQLGQEADLGYHQFQTGQLKKLGKETHNEVFSQYAQRFTQYLVTPPVLTPSNQVLPAIFPAADGFRDTVSVPFQIDKRSKITLVLFDSAGKEVARTSTTKAAGKQFITWNGNTLNGLRASEGQYTGQLTVTDIAGNRSRVDFPTPIRVVADTQAPRLRILKLRERKKISLITVNAFDFGSGWITSQVEMNGRVVVSRRGPRNGAVTLRYRGPLADVRQGSIRLVDTSGNVLSYPLAGR